MCEVNIVFCIAIMFYLSLQKWNSSSQYAVFFIYLMQFFVSMFLSRFGSYLDPFVRRVSIFIYSCAMERFSSNGVSSSLEFDE